MRRPQPAGPSISDNDRLSFTLLGAIALHALIILGVGFDYLASNASASSTIEVILVNTKTEQEPEKSVAISNNSQTASGSSELDNRPKQISKATQRNAASTEMSPGQASAAEKKSDTQQVLHARTSTTKTNIYERSDHSSLKQEQNPATQPKDELEQLVSELSNEEQLYAKRPKINHIDTLSAKTAVEAEYIKDWVKKVELIGNINYPTSAKKQGVSGQLIMSVLINHDGAVVETDIRTSSGHTILDAAARKVVQLAQPYREFPPEMRKEYDQLMITRTWLFKSNHTLSTH